MYTLTVVDRRVETLDTITLCFKQPGLKKIKYIAGQYLTLVFRINGRRYLRPYSFSSCPIMDRTLDVTIKRVHNGIVSNHIHDKVAIGDSIEVLEPMGDFVCENILEKEIYLWGVGSGVTPLISIAKNLLIQNSNVNVHLVYGNRDVEQTIFFDLIKSLQATFVDRFKVTFFYTQLTVEPDLPYWVQGRISKESICEILGKCSGYDSRHLICGPLGLKESVTSALLTYNVPRESILTEDFELIKDPKDFVDIKTRNINLEFEGNGFELEIVKGKSILESALDSGLELPYSCQTGNCSTCKALILQGEVKMIGLKEERKDLTNQETLLCCSYPISNDVVIKI